MDWAHRAYQGSVARSAESQRELLDRACSVLREKLQALLEECSRRVTLQLFLEPEAGGGFSEAAS